MGLESIRQLIAFKGISILFKFVTESANWLDRRPF